MRHRSATPFAAAAWSSCSAWHWPLAAPGGRKRQGGQGGQRFGHRTGATATGHGGRHRGPEGGPARRRPAPSRLDRGRSPPRRRRRHRRERHPRFSALSQLPTLLADIAGSGAETGRPFRLSVTEQKGALDDIFRAGGTVDLRCGLSCFDDPALAARVGYQLGLPTPEIKPALREEPRRLCSRSDFQLSLPGRRTSPGLRERRRVVGPGRGRTTRCVGRRWPPAPRSVNVAFLRLLAGPVVAGALVVLFTAASAAAPAPARVRPGPRGSRRRRAGGRRGFPVTGGR